MISSVCDRFWAKVGPRLPDRCWEWTASLTGGGYAQFRLGSKKVNGHRVSYLLEHGSIPEGLSILHRCHNRRCVNPAHLYAGTQKQNIADMHMAGHYRGGFEKLEACRKGHAFDEANTYYAANGYRHCRACGRDRKRRNT